MTHWVACGEISSCEDHPGCHRYDCESSKQWELVRWVYMGNFNTSPQVTRKTLEGTHAFKVWHEVEIKNELQTVEREERNSVTELQKQKPCPHRVHYLQHRIGPHIVCSLACSLEMLIAGSGLWITVVDRKPDDRTNLKVHSPALALALPAFLHLCLQFPFMPNVLSVHFPHGWQ